MQSFDIQDNLYYLGEPVIYSAFPDVANGTGIVTPDGIKSTGATLQEMDARDIGDTCLFENLDDIRSDPTRPRMVYDSESGVWRSAYSNTEPVKECPWCGKECPDRYKPEGCWYPDCPDEPHA